MCCPVLITMWNNVEKRNWESRAEMDSSAPGPCWYESATGEEYVAVAKTEWKQGFLWKRTERILAILISLLIRISGGEWYASPVSRQNENKTSGSEGNGRTQPPLQLAGELFELKLSKKNCFGVKSSGFPKFSTWKWSRRGQVLMERIKVCQGILDLGYT